MRLLRRSAAIMLVAAGIGTAACDEPLSNFTGPTENLRPTFSSIQANIFEAGDSSGRPACTACHNTQFALRNGRLDLTGAGAYSRLVNAPSSAKPGAVRVVPGDAENSYLIHKLEGRAGIVGLRMPISGPYLSDGQITIIERWIDTGAPND